MMGGVPQEPDDYQKAIASIREHLASRYHPSFVEYLAALRDGDDQQAAAIAERLEEASDIAESLWTRTLSSNASAHSNAVFVNEAAGAMAMLSDLWGDFAEVHRDRHQAE